jgi:hypothetical protein
VLTDYRVGFDVVSSSFATIMLGGEFFFPGFQLLSKNIAALFQLKILHCGESWSIEGKKWRLSKSMVAERRALPRRASRHASTSHKTSRGISLTSLNLRLPASRKRPTCHSSLL